MLSKPYMAPDTDSHSPAAELAVTPRRWQLSLTARILALNIFAILLLAGSLFYIDSFRARLVDERMSQAKGEADLIATALSDPRNRLAQVRLVADKTDARLRLIDANGRVEFDSWAALTPKFHLAEPDKEPWQRRFARGLDDIIDWLVVAKALPPFEGFGNPTSEGEKLTLAPDRTHIITSARILGGSPATKLVLDRNARDIRRLVRAERGSTSLILAFVTLLSALMSLYLARTIIDPLKRLAEAAANVRLGRVREVEVPRLPQRSDELGQLARSLSDMNRALQSRIDATEHFAADVAHEIKNPLASLSSAAESLSTIKDKKLQLQLIGIIRQDVTRLDRLITDISDLSRIDGQMARTDFLEIDLNAMLDEIIESYRVRHPDFADRMAFARPQKGAAIVRGDAARLVRVFENLLDNAISFSPPRGVISITATQARSRVVIAVQDDGPGVPVAARKNIFERFHSDRPGEDSFGKHSGLGLSIVKAIIEGHEGTIKVEGRGKGQTGARFVISLPLCRKR